MTGPGGVPEQPAAPDAEAADPGQPAARVSLDRSVDLTGSHAVGDTCAQALRRAADGDLDEALALARRALVSACAPPGPARLPMAVALQSLALVHALRGDPGQAGSCAGEAAAILEGGLVLRG